MTGPEIRALRLTLNLTQAALARRLGLAMGTVWNWEAGRHSPTPAMMRRLVRMMAAHTDPEKMP